MSFVHSGENHLPAVGVGFRENLAEPVEALPPPTVHYVEAGLGLRRSRPRLPRLVCKNIVQTTNFGLLPHNWVHVAERPERIEIPRDGNPVVLEVCRQEILVGKCPFGDFVAGVKKINDTRRKLLGRIQHDRSRVELVIWSWGPWCDCWRMCSRMANSGVGTVLWTPAAVSNAGERDRTH